MTASDVSAATFFLLALVLSSLTTSAGDRSPEVEAEIYALTAFKLSLHDPLGALSGWDASAPSAPCDWRGVACTDGRTTEIRLPRLQLGGRISDKLFNLRMLRKLSLGSNSFNGTIPDSLSKSNLLRSVYLHYNFLSGNLPQGIGNLTNLQILNLAHNSLSGEISELPPSLQYLDLSSNSFSGAIPRSIAANLSLLDLSFNNLTGQIPAGLGDLQALNYLWLDYNQLDGTLPSTIANCSSLVHLSAEGNALSGVVPAAYGALPKLQVLSLSKNALSGSLSTSLFCNTSGNASSSLRIVQLGYNAITDIAGPELVPCISGLQILDLQENRIKAEFPTWLAGPGGVSPLIKLDISGNLFSGPIPIEIGNFVKLVELRMASNSFHGSVPREIQKCSSLRVLDLDGNMFTGEIEGFLGGIRGLRVLSLGDNLFSGLFPATFYNLTELNILSLRGNGLRGSFPEELAMKLNNLSTLDISSNNFSGQLPSNIGNLSRLVVLNISRNEFSGAIPVGIGGLFMLTTLDISKQNLSGEIPIELFGLPNLQVIALQENNFSGDVPEGFSSLMSLMYLNLSANSFSGQVPSAIGFLRSLLVLSLSENRISGPIPTDLGNCSDLEVLELRSNSLTGTIPIDLSQLSNLKVLDLGGNDLSGEIPVEISNCSALNSLTVESNHLSGTIPGSLFKLLNLTTLDLSSNNLTGEIPAPNLGSLVFFNVSGNNLEGPIPVVLGSRFNSSSFANNQNLCGKPLDRKCEDTTAKKRKKLIVLIAIVASGAILLSLFCCFYIFSLLRWRKRLKEKASGEKKTTSSQGRVSSRSSGGGGGGGGRGSTDSNGVPKLVMFNDRISLADTMEATRQFDEENVLSRTRFGLVFKACYNDGLVLSIRRLLNGSLSLPENVFRKEAEALGKVKHRNLTVLRGYYAGPDSRLLVYDYMPNGNLATLLQEASHQDGHVLNWPMRHLIALGIARGLGFLHTCSIIHGDVKPQNVLFDADFEAHLSDFGLERLTEAAASASIGTLGYVAPEAVLTAETTKESDVYSFGIVVLELLTGKRSVMFEEEEDIVKWVKKQLQRGHIAELLEPGLLELDPESSEWEEFLLGVKVGLLCTAPDPSDRPTLSDVVFMLEGCRVGSDIIDPTSQPLSV